MNIVTKFQPGDMLYFIAGGRVHREPVVTVIIEPLTADDVGIEYRFSIDGPATIPERLVARSLVDLFDAHVVEFMATDSENADAVKHEWAALRAGVVPVRGTVNADGVTP